MRSGLRGRAAGSLWGSAGAHPALTRRARTVEQLEQRYVLVPERVKDAYLVHLLQRFQDAHEDWAVVVFTSTCKSARAPAGRAPAGRGGVSPGSLSLSPSRRTCQVLCMMLRKFGFPAVALHSMMKQVPFASRVPAPPQPATPCPAAARSLTRPAPPRRRSALRPWPSSSPASTASSSPLTWLPGG